MLLVSLPIGLICIHQTRPTQPTKLNPLQFAAIVIGLSGLILALNQTGVAVSTAVAGGAWASAAVIAAVSLVAGVGALVFFAWSSRRSFSPLIRLGWLRDPVVLLHLLPYTMLPMVGIGFGYVITNLAQLSLHTTALVAGMLVLPGALLGAFFAPVGGMLYDKHGPTRPILIAFACCIAAVALMLVFSMHLTPVLLALFYFVFGVGYALGFSNIMTDAINGIHREFTPDGNAVFNTALQFGGAAGTTLFSTVFAIAQAGAGAEHSPAFAHATAVGGAWTFAVMLAIVCVAWVCLFAAFRMSARRAARA